VANNKLNVIRRKQDFESLKLSGLRVTPNRWLLLSFKKNDLDHCRFGWTIGSKVGSAVVRNRFKRWCRDYFRQAQISTKVCLDLNVVIRPGQQDFYKQLSHDEFLEALDKGWRSAIKTKQ
jgi:ribonuclease P protein component